MTSQAYEIKPFNVSPLPIACIAQCTYATAPSTYGHSSQRSNQLCWSTSDGQGAIFDCVDGNPPTLNDSYRDSLCLRGAPRVTPLEPKCDASATRPTPLSNTDCNSLKTSQLCSSLSSPLSCSILCAPPVYDALLPVPLCAPCVYAPVADAELLACTSVAISEKMYGKDILLRFRHNNMVHNSVPIIKCEYPVVTDFITPQVDASNLSALPVPVPSHLAQDTSCSPRSEEEEVDCVHAIASLVRSLHRETIDTCTAYHWEPITIALPNEVHTVPITPLSDRKCKFVHSVRKQIPRKHMPISPRVLTPTYVFPLLQQPLHVDDLSNKNYASPMADKDVMHLCNESDSVYLKGLTIDSGAAGNVVGASWINHYKARLSKSLLQKWTKVIKPAQFRFGDNPRIVCTHADRIPIQTAKGIIYYETHIVPGDCPALVGLPTLRRLNITISFGDDRITIPKVLHNAPLVVTGRNHCILTFDSMRTANDLEPVADAFHVASAAALQPILEVPVICEPEVDNVIVHDTLHTDSIGPSNIISDRSKDTDPSDQDCSHNIFVCTNHDVSILEIFAGSAVFSQRCANRELKVLEPVDKSNGWDLRKASDRLALLNIVKSKKPSLVTLATHCTPWSQAWTVNLKEKARQQNLDRCLWDFTELIANEQDNNNRLFLIENPARSAAWKLRCMKRVMNRASTQCRVLHMCMYGMRDPVSLKRYFKPTLILTNCIDIADRLSKVCNKAHEHEQLCGAPIGHPSRTKIANRWPLALLDSIIDGLLANLTVTIKDTQCYPIECKACLYGSYIYKGGHTYIPDECTEAPLSTIDYQPTSRSGQRKAIQQGNDLRRKAEAKAAASKSKSKPVSRTPPVATDPDDEDAIASALEQLGEIPDVSDLPASSSDIHGSAHNKDFVGEVQYPDDSVIPLDDPKDTVSVQVDRNTPIRRVLRRSYIHKLKTADDTEAFQIISRLHRRYMHLPGRELASILRSIGCTSDRAQLAFEAEKRCAACRARQRPARSPKFSSAKIESFNHTLQIDVIFRQKAKEERALHIIDVSSRLSVIAEIKSRDQHDVLDAFCLNWVKLFGWPKRIVADADKSWVNLLWRQKCDERGCNLEPAAAQSHTTVGLIDRHTHLIKENAEKLLIDDLNTPWIIALSEACGAKNKGLVVRGYCPLELAFGHKPDDQSSMLRSLASEEKQMIEDDTEDEVLRAVKRRMKAIEIFNKDLSVRKTQAALSDAQQSGSTVEYAVGDTVEFWRDPDARWKSGWHGPADIVAVSDKVINLKWQGTVIGCQANQLRVFDVMHVDCLSDHDDTDTYLRTELTQHMSDIPSGFNIHTDGSSLSKTEYNSVLFSKCTHPSSRMYKHRSTYGLSNNEWKQFEKEVPYNDVGPLSTGMLPHKCDKLYTVFHTPTPVRAHCMKCQRTAEMTKAGILGICNQCTFTFCFECSRWNPIRKQRFCWRCAHEQFSSVSHGLPSGSAGSSKPGPPTLPPSPPPPILPNPSVLSQTPLSLSNSHRFYISPAAVQRFSAGAFYTPHSTPVPSQVDESDLYWRQLEDLHEADHLLPTYPANEFTTPNYDPPLPLTQQPHAQYMQQPIIAYEHARPQYALPAPSYELLDAPEVGYSMLPLPAPVYPPLAYIPHTPPQYMFSDPTLPIASVAPVAPMIDPLDPFAIGYSPGYTPSTSVATPHDVVDLTQQQDTFDRAAAVRAQRIANTHYPLPARSPTHSVASSGPVNVSDDAQSISSGSTILLSHIFSIVQEDSTMTKAECDLYVKQVLAAKNKETNSFQVHDVYVDYDLSRVPKDSKILGCVWILKWKQFTQKEKAELSSKPNACVVGTRKIKARLCIQGCQDPHKFYVVTESPTARLQSLRLQFHLTVQLSFEFESWDVSTAFLRGEAFGPNDRPIFVNPPHEIRKHSKCWLLKKAAYGLGEAPLRFFKKLAGVLIGKVGMRQCVYDPCVFTLYDKDGSLMLLITTHVDDLLVSGTRKCMDHVRSIVESHLGELTVETDTFTHLGCEISRGDKGSMKLSLERFCKHMPIIDISASRGKELESLVTPEEKTQLESGIGAGSWAARMCRIDIARDIAMLQSVVSKANVSHLKWYNKVAKRLLETSSDSYLLYHKLEGDPTKHVCQVITDSAFKNAAESKSHAGQIVRIANSMKPGGLGNVIDWSSKKLSRSVSSTFGAELLSHVKGVNMAFAIMYIFREMLQERPALIRVDDVSWRQPPCPISSFSCLIGTHTDCRSLWDNLQSNKLPTESNLWPDVTFLKHMFADNTIASHYWTNTHDMCADALTKDGLDITALMELMRGIWKVNGEWREAKKPSTIHT